MAQIQGGTAPPDPRDAVLKGELMAKDPVCNMDVDERTAAGKSEFRGQAYYFCSEQCKQQFDKNPERYAGGQPAAGKRAR